MSIEDIDEEGLLDCQNNQATEFNDLETDPLVEEQDRDSEDNVGETESNPMEWCLVMNRKPTRLKIHMRYLKDSDYVKERPLNLERTRK